MFVQLVDITIHFLGGSQVWSQAHDVWQRPFCLAMAMAQNFIVVQLNDMLTLLFLDSYDLI